MFIRWLRKKFIEQTQPLLAGMILLAGVVVPTASYASNPAIYTIGITAGRPAFGNIVSARVGSATFTETPGGTITASGGGFDPPAASRTVSAQTVTISCGSGNNCASQVVHVVVTGSGTGRITGVTFTAAMGSAVLAAGHTNVTTGSSLDFYINAIGKSSSKNFTLGVAIVTSSAGTTTAGTAPYSISASGGAADTSGGNSTSATATILKGLSLGSSQSLNFGAIVTDGTAGTVVLNALGTTRAKTGGVTLLKSQASNPIKPALFSISGEIGTNVTVSFVPANLTGTGAAMPLSVTSTVVGTITLSADPTSVSVGGAITVNASQKPGLYTGSVSMTVTYN